ncbi:MULTISPECIES: hypothetical protein [Nostoc]|nr:MULTISPECIES: hypothetical protein [Nostoc]
MPSPEWMTFATNITGWHQKCYGISHLLDVQRRSSRDVAVLRLYN